MVTNPAITTPISCFRFVFGLESCRKSYLSVSQSQYGSPTRVREEFTSLFSRLRHQTQIVVKYTENLAHCLLVDFLSNPGLSTLEGALARFFLVFQTTHHLPYPVCQPNPEYGEPQFLGHETGNIRCIQTDLGWTYSERWYASKRRLRSYSVSSPNLQ